MCFHCVYSSVLKVTLLFCLVSWRSLALYGLRGGNALSFMRWFWRCSDYQIYMHYTKNSMYVCMYINCLFVCLLEFLSHFLPFFLFSFCFFPYFFTSLLMYFLTYLSTSFRIDQFCFQARCHRRRRNLALVFNRQHCTQRKEPVI